MGRLPLGEAKKTEVVSIRMTKDEREQLEQVFGKAAKGLEFLHGAWKEAHK